MATKKKNCVCGCRLLSRSKTKGTVKNREKSRSKTAKNVESGR